MGGQCGEAAGAGGGGGGQGDNVDACKCLPCTIRHNKARLRAGMTFE